MAKGTRYPDESIQLGLRVLALCGGQAAQASRLLASEGYEIPRNTLTGWKNRRYSHRYAEMLHEHRQEIGERTADLAMELAGRAQTVSAELVEKTHDKADAIEPKDLARSALALTQVSAEQVRTGRLLRDLPTGITEVRDPREIVRELQALDVVKLEQENAIDAEVVDESVSQ
jgi:hypothetical protein